MGYQVLGIITRLGLLLSAINSIKPRDDCQQARERRIHFFKAFCILLVLAVDCGVFPALVEYSLWRHLLQSSKTAAVQANGRICMTGRAWQGREADHLHMLPNTIVEIRCSCRSDRE